MAADPGEDVDHLEEADLIDKQVQIERRRDAYEEGTRGMATGREPHRNGKPKKRGVRETTQRRLSLQRLHVLTASSNFEIQIFIIVDTQTKTARLVELVLSQLLLVSVREHASPIQQLVSLLNRDLDSYGPLRLSD